MSASGPNPFLPPDYMLTMPGIQRFAAAEGMAGADILPTARDQQHAPQNLPTSGMNAEVASSLAGLTVQQMLDLDVEQLAVKIDTHQSKTKKAILDHFMDSKARLMAAQTQAVEEERQAGARALATKQAEIDLLRFELHQMTTRTNKLAELLRRAAAAYDSTKHSKRNLTLLAQSFYSWRQHVINSRQRKMRAARAEQWYIQEHLKRHVLQGWFRVAQQQHRVTLHNRHVEAVDAARSETAAQWGVQVDELRRQLAEAHGVIAREQAARERLEENMKQAFMRGVCALNIEAMSIMKRGAPPGGANPVPVVLPGAPLSQAPGVPGPMSPAMQQPGSQAYGSVVESGLQRADSSRAPSAQSPSAAGREPASVPMSRPGTASAAAGMPAGAELQPTQAFSPAAGYASTAGQPSMAPSTAVSAPRDGGMAAASGVPQAPAAASSSVSSTAQAYYQQRPRVERAPAAAAASGPAPWQQGGSNYGSGKVFVERAGAAGMGAGLSGSLGDVPKPRAAIPTPTARPQWQAPLGGGR